MNSVGESLLDHVKNVIIMQEKLLVNNIVEVEVIKFIIPQNTPSHANQFSMFVKFMMMVWKKHI